MFNPDSDSDNDSSVSEKSAGALFGLNVDAMHNPNTSTHNLSEDEEKIKQIIEEAYGIGIKIIKASEELTVQYNNLPKVSVKHSKNRNIPQTVFPLFLGFNALDITRLQKLLEETSSYINIGQADKSINLANTTELTDDKDIARIADTMDGLTLASKNQQAHQISFQGTKKSLNERDAHDNSGQVSLGSYVAAKALISYYVHIATKQDPNAPLDPGYAASLKMHFGESTNHDCEPKESEEEQAIKQLSRYIDVKADINAEMSEAPQKNEGRAVKAPTVDRKPQEPKRRRWLCCS